MKQRTLAVIMKKAAKTFPALVITGPRQSGKTTLVKSVFGKTHTYVNLEDLDIRGIAASDPRQFLANYPKPLIIDEIQYVPELLSYIKTQIDADRVPGQWILTGSQHFPLMKHISDSLAGRIAVMSLLPFTAIESVGQGAHACAVELPFTEPVKSLVHHKTHQTLETMMLRGAYPELVSNANVDRRIWFNSYLTTYLERDIRNMKQVGDLRQFELFVRLLATRTGQILNISDVARDNGISVPTAKTWISLLETGYQIHLLYPYYRNIGKRLIKSPKIYFTDTGFAAFLLGIHDINTLRHNPSYPHLFETFIVSDFLKRFYHTGVLPTMYYLRTRDGLEIDIVLEAAAKLHFVEIKSAMTILPEHSRQLTHALRDIGTQKASATIISRASTSIQVTRSVRSISWQDALLTKPV